MMESIDVVYKYTVLLPQLPVMHGVTAMNLDANPGRVSLRTACGVYDQVDGPNVFSDHLPVTCIACLSGDAAAYIAKAFGSTIIQQTGDDKLRLNLVI